MGVVGVIMECADEGQKHESGSFSMALVAAAGKGYGIPQEGGGVSNSQSP